MIEKPASRVEISLTTLLWILGLVAGVYVLYLVKDLLIDLFIAFIFMSALRPSVDNLEKKRVPRIISVLLMVLLTLSGLGLFVYYVFPVLINESAGFVIYLYQMLSKNLVLLNTQFDTRNLIPLNSLTQALPDLTITLTHILSGLFSNLMSLISIIFFTIYFLMDIKHLNQYLSRFLNEKQTHGLLETIAQVEKKLGAWVRGELVLMTIIGITSYIGLSLLGVRYAVPLAVLSGLFEVFPIIGPVFSAVFAFMVATGSNFVLGLTVIVLYIVIQQAENNLIVPFVMKQSVGLSPLVTLISLVVGEKLLGTVGVILAVPIITTLLIIFQELNKYHNSKN